MRPMLSGVAALTLLLCVIAAGPVGGQPTYMGLYLDEGRTSWCATGTVPYQVELWIYGIIEGGIKEGGGIYAYAFDLTWSPNVSLADWIDNPHIEPFECLPGYCPPGISGSFDTCLGDWVWLKRIILNVTTSDPALVQIVPVPEYGAVRLHGCNDAIHNAVVVRDVYLNYNPGAPECGSPLAVEESTWGMIKSLYQ
jgi:hypothetical protein